MLLDLFSGVDPAAQSVIRSYCGWHIAPVVVQEIVLDGPGGTLLSLPTLRLVDVEFVENDGRPVTDPQWSGDGMIRGHWSDRFRGIRARIRHGYDECPPEIIAAADRLLRTERLAGMGTVRIGGISVQAEAPQVASPALDPYVVGILDRYRIQPRP